MKNLKLIISYLKRYKKSIALGVLCLIIVDAIQMVVPKIIQHVIDYLHKPEFTTNTILVYAGIIFGLALIMAVLRFLWRIFLITNSFKIEKKIRNDYYEHLQKLSPRFFQDHNTGDLMAYATNDLNAVRMLFGIGVVLIFDVVFVTIASLLLMSNINFKMTLFVIIPLPIVTFVMIYFGKKVHRLFKKVQTTFAHLSDRVQETISGIRIIKSFVREKAYEDRIGTVAEDLVDQNIKLVKIWGMFFPLMFAIIGISLLLTLYIGGTKTILREITIGEFVAFNSYLHLIIWPVIAVGWIVNLYQRGTASLNRIQDIMHTKPEIIDEPDIVDPSITEIKGEITIKNLTYSYPDTEIEVLKGIDFNVKPGETLAIVGRTGEGKSTIVKLLTRMFNPPKNQIYLDDHEIYQVPLRTLRDSIAVVTQEIFLFASSVQENIQFGNEDVTMDDIIEIAEISQFHNDIKEFEMEFDSIVGERGVSLSGGQKQRLALSRALIKNAPILILDDAFSSVDTETEEIILKNIRVSQKGKTVLMIAHRISTMQHADKIIVLSDGKVAEQGTHESLLKQNGIYTDIYKRQKLREELEL
ncbi:MAG: ABC transporter ATP-binding protein [Candidatus Cloacimonetes bacterium]|nr:ABC transporter ATP-binding protein [Candidatus Cloacimonadota bacterium]